MRPSWVIWRALNLIVSVLMRDAHRGRRRRPRGDRGRDWGDVAAAQEHLGAMTLGEVGRPLPQGLWREHGPADT